MLHRPNNLRIALIAGLCSVAFLDSLAGQRVAHGIVNGPVVEQRLKGLET